MRTLATVLIIGLCLVGCYKKEPIPTIPDNKRIGIISGNILYKNGQVTIIVIKIKELERYSNGLSKIQVIGVSGCSDYWKEKTKEECSEFQNTSSIQWLEVERCELWKNLKK